MEAQNLLFLAITGFAVMALTLAIDTHARRRAMRDHYLARMKGHAFNGLARAETMVQNRCLTGNQRVHVLTYIDLLERAHQALGAPRTATCKRLRQTLTRNSAGLSVVV